MRWMFCGCSPDPSFAFAADTEMGTDHRFEPQELKSSLARSVQVAPRQPRLTPSSRASTQPRKKVVPGSPGSRCS